MLLRALEEKTFLPLGSDEEARSDFQLIAGTSRDLFTAVQDKDGQSYKNAGETLVKCWIRGRQFGKTLGFLHLEHEAYKVGAEIRFTPQLFDTVPGSRQHLIRADCARPETISAIHNAGFRIEAAEKWKGSVEDGIAVLRSFEKIIIHLYAKTRGRRRGRECARRHKRTL